MDFLSAHQSKKAKSSPKVGLWDYRWTGSNRDLQYQRRKQYRSLFLLPNSLKVCCLGSVRRLKGCHEHKHLLSYCFIILSRWALVRMVQMAPCSHQPQAKEERPGTGAYPPQKLQPTFTHTPATRKAGKCLYFGQPAKIEILLREEENRHWRTASSLSSIFLENFAFKKGEWEAQGGRNHHLMQRTTSGFKDLSHPQKGLCCPWPSFRGHQSDWRERPSTPRPRGLPLWGSGPWGLWGGLEGEQSHYPTPNPSRPKTSLGHHDARTTDKILGWK